MTYGKSVSNWQHTSTEKKNTVVFHNVVSFVCCVYVKRGILQTVRDKNEYEKKISKREGKNYGNKKENNKAEDNRKTQTCCA
jgi:hypothetical protein